LSSLLSKHALQGVESKTLPTETETGHRPIFFLIKNCKKAITLVTLHLVQASASLCFKLLSLSKTEKNTDAMQQLSGIRRTQVFVSKYIRL
jgi:hypothetical protein